MQLNFNILFAVASLLLGSVLGLTIQIARRQRFLRGLLFATVATIEFGFLVTGTRKVEGLLFVFSALGLVVAAALLPPVLGRLACLMLLGLAVYYFVAFLFESWNSQSATPAFASLLEVVVYFVFSMLIYAFLRFILGLALIERVANHVTPFRSEVTAGVAVGVALALFYVIPILEGLAGGGTIPSTFIRVADYIYCLWVLGKCFLPGNKSLLALSLAFTLSVVGMPVDTTYNPGRLLGMAIVGYNARSLGIFLWPKTKLLGVFWMAFWYVATSVVLSGRLEPGSRLYPGSLDANWPLLVASLCAFAFGLGVLPLTATPPLRGIQSSGA